MKPLKAPRFGLSIFLDRLSTQEKINFARHLAMVIKAGLPMYQGLTILKEQASSRALSRIITQVIADVNNGRFLADSLSRYEDTFGAFFINLIRVGEASGTLPQNLAYLADELRKSKNLRSKVRSAMVYPIVILIATIGVTGFLAFFVFPKLLPVLLGLGVKLPPTTLALIAVVNYIQNYGIYTLAGAVVLFILLRVIVRMAEPIRYAIDRVILAIPVISQLTVSVNMVNFTRILALLLKSGVRIVEALTITSNTFGNLVYRRAVLGANDEIKKGGQLATYLASKKRIFPPILSDMIRVGENTGNLEENLSYLAEYYEEEVDNKLHGLTSLLEPVLLLVMGMVVGFVALSIITPIYSISQGVK
jgi:type IV pilus assembly protein PilC